MPRSPFRGCLTAIVTPFKAGHVDFAALGRIVEAQVAAGVGGIVPCGTTGESPTLSHDEHRAVIHEVVKRVARRTLVVAGCGSNSTDEALGLTRFAAEVGADATLQVAPYYNKPTQEGLFRHFEAIARATPLPLMLYNVPGRTGVSIAPATVARLSKIDTIVAIKEASGSLDVVSEIMSLCEIDVLSGDDSLTLPMLAIGAAGVVSVAGNVAPAAVQELCARFDAGDLAAARTMHARLFPLVRSLFCESNPGPVKAAMAMLGMCAEELRLPLVPVEDASRARVRGELVRFGLLARGE